MASQAPLREGYVFSTRPLWPLSHGERHSLSFPQVVEARADVSAPLGEAERTAEGRTLEHNIKSLIGISTRVKVVEPGKVERSQGKAKRVIDLRPKG